jgi:phospholipid N-methyltransferase
MSDASLFLRKFLRHGLAIASVTPSSRWLSRATVRPIDWDHARTIVELGAGTGPITRVIAERAHPDCRVVVIERDPDFFKILQSRYESLPNFEVAQGDVRYLLDVLAGLGIDRVDHVVSGLATPSLPTETRHGLFEALRSVLGTEGGYHQITEVPLIYFPFYRRHFEHVRFVFEPRNIPPGGVYHCRVVRPAS